MSAKKESEMLKKLFKKFLILVSAVSLLGCFEVTPIVSMRSDEEAKIENDTIYTGWLYGGKIQYRIIDGKKIWQGDIVLTDEQLGEGALSKSSGAACATLSMRWPNNVVYYNIDPTFPNPQRVRDAIQMWESATLLRFIEVTQASNYITFKPHTSRCFSNLGMKGGRQYIECANTFDSGNLAHEIGHAVGLFHEHSRSTRDNDIDVLYNNIRVNEHDQFQTYTQSNFGCGTGFDSGPFDYNSIMLYGSFNTFAIVETLPTMRRRIDHSTWDRQRTFLSAGDIRSVAFLYTPPWRKFPGQARDIAVGDNGGIWVIGNTAVGGGYSIHRWNGSNWTRVSGGAMRIAVENSGIPWVVNSSNEIFRGNLDGSSWQKMPGLGRDIGAGSLGVWVIGVNQQPGGYSVHRWNGSGWVQSPGGAERITVGPNGPWTVNSFKEIHEWTVSGWVKRPGYANDIAMNSLGRIFVIGNDPVAGGYRVHEWTGVSWVPTRDGAGTNIAVSPNGMPWITNSSLDIFSW